VFSGRKWLWALAAAAYSNTITRMDQMDHRSEQTWMQAVPLREVRREAKAAAAAAAAVASPSA
jgi:hypothetical protein